VRIREARIGEKPRENWGFEKVGRLLPLRFKAEAP
jgi:hypothetical protein